MWYRCSALLRSISVLECQTRFTCFGSILPILQHIREIQNYPDRSRLIFSLQYSLPRTSPLLRHAFKLFRYPGRFRGQLLTARVLQILRNAIKRLGDAASNGRRCIAVAAGRYHRAECILKTCAFQKCSDGLRHRLPAVLRMTTGGANLLTGAAKIIPELTLRICPDVCPAASCAPLMLSGRSWDTSAVSCARCNAPVISSSYSQPSSRTPQPPSG